MNLSRPEWRRAAVLAAAILALHLLGFSILLAGGGITAGIALTAYTLGMRHAFDADHLAAIDNTTRKLMSDGQRPLSVGFWFRVWPSSVVFPAWVLLGVGIKALSNGISDDHSGLHTITGTIGPTVSGTFLG